MKYFRNKYSEVELTKKNNWADIYSAINNSTNEKVQLRILKRQSNNTNYINLITSKINELQGLKHENLIGINGINSFIENEGVYYYIETEYFNGKSLSDRMILKSHTCKESLEIIKQVAKGLNEFHYRGLNYETLSAENIFINSQNVVKLDVLSYISQKYDEDEEYDDYEEVEEEIDNDIYAIGTILYQLITRDSDFKLKKLKKNIDDDEIYSMLYALTSKKKKYKYENLNAFLCDINEYLSSDYKQGVDGYETDEEYEEDYEDKKFIIIKRFCACLAVVLVLGGGIKVMGLVKGDKDENEATIEMAIEKESTDNDVEKQEMEEVEEDLEQDQLEETQAESTDNKTTSNSTTSNNNTNKENTNTTQNSNNESTTTKPVTGSTNSGNGSTTTKPGTGSTSSGSGSGNQGTSGSTSSGSGSGNQGTSGSTSSGSGNGNQGTSEGTGSEGGSGDQGTSGSTSSGNGDGNQGTSGDAGLEGGSGDKGASEDNGSGSGNENEEPSGIQTENEIVDIQSLEPNEDTE